MDTYSESLIDSTEPICSKVTAHAHLGAVNSPATRDLWVQLIQHFELQSDFKRPLMCLKAWGARQPCTAASSKENLKENSRMKLL